MKNRMFKRIALTSAVLALSIHAEVCNEKILYDGSHSSGYMEESSRQFPEAPEWAANWGDFSPMKPPYIRFSGIKNIHSDWTGQLIFKNLPVKVNGGKLSFLARATQNSKLGVWLSGDFGTGKVVYRNLNANQTHSIEIPVADIGSVNPFTLTKVGVGLFGVESNQYTTFFIDDMKLSCTGGNSSATSSSSSASVPTISSSSSSLAYHFTEVTPHSVERTPLDESERIPAAKAYYSKAVQDSLKKETKNTFVLSSQERMRIQHAMKNDSLTPNESRKVWYNALFFVEKNRLQEEAIANPSQLFSDAGVIAASKNKEITPILLADLDYSYALCADTLCSKFSLADDHLLLAGLPISSINSSKLTVVYDPYFVITQKNTRPAIELCVASKCIALQEKSSATLEFDSAGIQKITVKLRSGTHTAQHNIFVEVK